MKYMQISRTSYLIAAVIVLIYILTLVLGEYASYHEPLADNSLRAELFQGNWPLHLIYSVMLPVGLFAILYPFLLICMHNYNTSPLASILAFMGMFFFCSVKICLQIYSLLEMQHDLPVFLMTTNGPDVERNALNAFSEFRRLQWVLDFPLTFGLLISSLLLAVTLKRRPDTNVVLKVAFFLNAGYLLIHLNNLIGSTNELVNYYQAPFLPAEIFVYAIILIWLIAVFFKKKTDQVTPDPRSLL